MLSSRLVTAIVGFESVTFAATVSDTGKTCSSRIPDPPEELPISSDTHCRETTSAPGRVLVVVNDNQTNRLGVGDRRNKFWSHFVASSFRARADLKDMALRPHESNEGEHPAKTPPLVW